MDGGFSCFVIAVCTYAKAPHHDLILVPRSVVAVYAAHLSPVCFCSVLICSVMLARRYDVVIDIKLMVKLLLAPNGSYS